MDVHSLKRDAALIHKAYTVTPEGAVVTNRQMEVHLPKRFINNGMAVITEKVTTAAVLGLVIPGVAYAPLVAVLSVTLLPLSNREITVDGEQYLVLEFEEGKYLNVEIAKLTGVDEYSISKVKCKKDWVHISQLYNIKTPVANAVGSDAVASKYTDEMIHSVCKLLSNKNNSMSYVSEQTGVGYDMVYRIKKGLNWSHISSCYPELGISRSDTTTQDKLG